MKRLFQFTIIILIFSRCEEVITPDIDQVNSCLVVDGMISSVPSLNRIYVTASRPYGGSPYVTSVSGLTVYVIDNNENRINFNEINSTGTYASEANNESAAKVGNTYTLYIETPEGTTYVSTPQKVQECPKISSLYINAETESVLTEDSYGDVKELDFPGFSIYNDTKGILPEQNYYLYRWYGYEEHRATITPVGGGESSTIYRHRSISGNYIRIICSGNADEFYDKIMRRNKFVFIPKFAFLEYQPIFPDTFTFAGTAFDGILFASEQFSISKDVYNYWKGAEDQLNADGKIFDPVSAQLKGNIVCTSDPSKLAFGTFYATDMKIRYDYLYINSKNKTYTRQLDSMPELWLDTCSWSVPDGWIFPPI